MKYVIENEKNLAVTKECDVLVAGGGIAGVTAAVAAARCGEKVILVENACALGGLGTLGLITFYLPLCDGLGNQVIFGIGEELLKLSIKYGYERRYPKAWIEGGTLEEKKKQRYAVGYNSQIFSILLEKLLLDEGVEIIYNTRVYGTKVVANKIDYVFIVNKEGQSAIKAKTVVDATGDADICEFCGDDTALYTKNRFAAWHYVTSERGYECIAHAIKLYDELPKNERTYDGLKSEDETQMIIRGHKEILENVLSLRKKWNDDSVMPATIPTVPSFRMTRRLMGHYELSQKDVFKSFSDCVGLTGDWRKNGPVYQIPYRSLYSKNIVNLITAGRCISTDEGMWDITRVIPTCAVTGQAAGTAAALVSSHNTTFLNLDVKTLQNRLKRDGVLLNYPCINKL